MTKPLGPYTPVVRAGDWLIVSGQLGQLDGKLVEGLGAQTSQAVANLTTLLEGEGAALTDVAKTLCFLVDFSPEVSPRSTRPTWPASPVTARPAPPSAWPPCPVARRSRSRRGPTSRSDVRPGHGRPAALAWRAWLESSRILIALVVVPVGFIMSMTAVAGLLGTLLTRDGAARHEGSELLELNR